VLDYSGSSDAIGKNVGDDLREGKPTLPLIYLLQRGTSSQQALVKACIESGDETHFGEVLSAITISGALEYTREKAAEASASATRAITGFPNSQFKDSLLELCAFAIGRNH
jgi:octaprenyl-diphosphate synthase